MIHEPLEPRLHLAATLLQDFNTHSSFDPSREIVEAGGVTFLVAHTTRYGSELWRLDEDPDRPPKLVADLDPGPESSSPRDLVALNGLLLFIADVPELGHVLMRSDGTADGTTVLHDADQRPGKPRSINTARAPVGGRLFFSVSTNANYTTSALFLTDGTAAGTRPVNVPAKAPRQWHLGRALAIGDDFYLPASRGRHFELWVIDRASDAAARRIDLPAGSATAPRLQRIDDVLYVATSRDADGGSPRIWKLTPDDDDEPQRVAQFGPKRTLHNLAAVGDELLFTVSRGQTHAPQLWKLDPAATRGAVKVSGSGAAPPAVDYYRHSAVWNGHLYFAPEKGGLWRSDGTPQGTRRIASDLPHPTQRILTILPREDGIYFLAEGLTHGYHLWHTDGARTRLVSELDANTGTGSDSISLVGDKIAYLTYPRHLWISDGTTAGTYPVPPPTSVATLGSNPSVGVNFNGSFYFAAGDDSLDGESNALWKTDGTAAGTTLVRRFDHTITRIDVVAGRLLMWEALGYLGLPNGTRLWSTDGTAHGTVILRDVQHARSWPTPRDERYIYAASDNAWNFELWSTDGTADGTSLIKDINPGPAASAPKWLATIGDITFFSADDGTHGRELWRTDGTPDGTILLADLVPGDRSIESISGVAASGQFYFTFTTPSGVSDVWVTDGTLDGTKPHADWNNEAARSVRATVQLAGDAYFFARAKDGSVELWRSQLDRDAATLVKRFDRWQELADPKPVVANGRIFFNLSDSYQLWSSDGTESGTQPVSKKFRDYPPQSFHVLSDHILYVATDYKHGRQLWQSDGTPGGTKRLTAIADGNPNSVSHILGLFNDTVVISANDGHHGPEPWLIQLD